MKTALCILVIFALSGLAIAIAESKADVSQDKDQDTPNNGNGGPNGAGSNNNKGQDNNGLPSLIATFAGMPNRFMQAGARLTEGMAGDLDKGLRQGMGEMGGQAENAEKTGKNEITQAL